MAGLNPPSASSDSPRAAISSRERFLAACGCRPLDRPPVWVMRQAGRYLPEYRALKEKHTFVEMVRTPDLATEVTLQPLRRFDLDAAILFSDILVVPEALGLPYHFRDGGGIAMERRLETPQDIAALRPASAVREHLAYVPAALRQIRGEIGDRKALLGFAGSPWTLACYMIDGGSSDDFARAKALFHADRPAFDALMERLTEATIQHLLAQIEAGADAVQIFDSWAGIIPGVDYEAASLAWIRAIVSAIGDRAPVIVFARGAAPSLGPLTTTGASVLGLDWTIDLAAAAAVLPAHVAVQGNLDPVLLNTSPEIVTREATRLLEGMRGRPGHIFNLGHGIMPQARLECMAALVETVISFS